MLPRVRARAAARCLPLVAAGLVALSGSSCILDLDGLTTPAGGAGGGGEGGSGGATTAGGTGGAPGGSGGGGTGGAGCSLLDCCPEGEVLEIQTGSALAGLPRGLVVRDDGLYWANEEGGNLVHAPAGGAPTTPIAQALSPRDLATSGDLLAWSASDGAHLCQLPDCAATAHLAAGSASQDSVRGVALDADRLVFSDAGAAPGQGKIFSCPPADCAPLMLAENMMSAGAVRLSGSFAYWVDPGNGNQNGNLARSPKDTFAYQQLTAELNLPSGIAVDETYIYWTEKLESGRVLRCPLSAGFCQTPEEVAPAGSPYARPDDIAIRGGRIYWSTATDGRILSCPQPGCGDTPPKVHVTSRTGLSRIAIGNTCLFWTESSSGGAVLKTAR
ncbi:MAG: hypothetical protein R3B70_13395 [Polyangiaceae bacterium]